MEIKGSNEDIGVIIGRFQTPYLSFTFREDKSKEECKYEVNYNYYGGKRK